MAGEWLNAGLPASPQLDGYSELPADYRQRFQTEAGPDIVRDETTAKRTRIRAVYMMRTAQVLALYRLIDDVGAATFLLPDPIWVPEWGQPYEISARFERMPAVRARDHDIWDVEVEMLVTR